MFGAKGDLLLTPETKFENIFVRSTKDSAVSLVQQYDNEGNDMFTKKFKDLHGICCINVKKVTELNELRIIDPSLQLTKTSENVPDDAPIVKEIHEFLQFQSFVPNFFYINNMYVYLLHANLGSRSGRNITVRIQVKDNDKDLNSPGLRVS